MPLSPFFLTLLSVASVVTARCVQSIVPLYLHAKNFDLSDPTFNTTVPVSGAFELEVNFCPPTNSTLARSHADTLLVTVPGATYGPIYWDFPFQPETYNFVRYANSRGLAVLNFARLGTPRSNSRGAYADPETLQMPLQVAAEIEILRLSRQGIIPGARGKRFSKLVGIGHSLSSSILNGVIVSSPKILDGAVFTGYGHILPPPSGIAIIPANQANVPRFANLPDGYLTTQNSSRSSRGQFYGPDGTFDPAVLEFDEAHKSTVSVGEFSTLTTTLISAPEFHGHVLAVNGLQDFGCLPPSCDVIKEEAQFYPRARTFETAVIPNSGHDLNLHLIAPLFFNTVIAWAESHGF